MMSIKDNKLLLSLIGAVFLLSACSSDKVVEEVEKKDTPSDPMRFTCKLQENTASSRSDATRADVTRASAEFDKDFMISTYKSFNLPGQQTVMDSYHVKHSTSGTDWDGNVSHNWNYVGVDGQIERYWDYSAFPYRFNAVAPYPADKSKITVTDTKLEIDAPYKMQTWSDGVKSNFYNGVTSDPVDSDAEPYWVAQVQRAADGKDTDVFTGKPIGNAATSTTLNRYVAMPFHHLNSKVRFAIYTTSAWATAHPMYIENLSIRVESENFVTGAGKYTATGNSATDNTWYIGTGTSGFTNLTKAASPGTEILHYTGVDADHNPLPGNDLSQWQTKQTAFWFDSKVKDGLMQIPQDGVKLTLSMNLFLIDGDDVLVVPFNNVPITLALEGQEPTELNHWKSGNIYTYYLILDNVGEKLEIHFTATLTPWEDLSGTLSTDLEQ